MEVDARQLGICQVELPPCFGIRSNEVEVFAFFDSAFIIAAEFDGAVVVF